MVLCDTNVFIHAFNGHELTINQLFQIGLPQVALSAITLMELYQGMVNRDELVQMKKKLRYYDIIQVDNLISSKAIELIENFKLSHGLQIPDAIIGATAIVYDIPLYTYNLKDFNFMSEINLHII